MEAIHAAKIAGMTEQELADTLKALQQMPEEGER